MRKAASRKLDPSNCKHPQSEQYPLRGGDYVCRLCGATLVGHDKKKDESKPQC